MSIEFGDAIAHMKNDIDRTSDDGAIGKAIKAGQKIMADTIERLTNKRKSPAPKAPPAPKRISIASAIDSAPNTSQPSDSSGLTRTSH